MVFFLPWSINQADLPGQRAGGLDANLHVGEHEADTLVVVDGLPKRRAFAGILDGFVQRTAGHAGGGGGDGRAALVKDLHADHETVAFVPEQVLGRYFHVLKEDLAGLGCMLAQLLQRLACADAGEVALDDKATHAAVARGRVGLGEDREVAGDGTIGDPCLGAVKDVLVSLAHGRGLDAGHVRTCIGLGHTVGHDLAFLRQAGEVLFLLLLVGGD